MTLRLPKWLLVGCGAALAAIAIGGAVWLLALRDTGPSEAELREQRIAREQAKALRLAKECKRQAARLMTALEDLEGRLGGLGLTYADYSTEVGDASSAYQTLNVGKMKLKCLSRVGVPLERALNSYIEAGNIWDDCIQDFGCDIDSIDPDLQQHWGDAGEASSKARIGLAGLFKTAR